ncbi:MAG: HlyD family efflux transporter periplasmic adaptor subunit [Clostridia bacterium]|nr:HlyD family efflux transporter periplasmic adaptor subunit [Clostridia bacterium]
MEKAKPFFSKIKSSLAPILEKTRPVFTKVFAAAKVFVKKHKIWSVVILILLVLLFSLLFRGIGRKNDMPVNFSEFTVSRQTISSSVTGSSVLEPNAEYTITPLVTGEILDAPFEEGDIVTKGQVMYRIDAETMENTLSGSDISIKRAQKNYQDAAEDVANQTVRSSIAGRIAELYVKNGDTVGNGTKIASVINDSVMKIRIPFNEPDIPYISKGMTATVTLAQNGSQLPGTVTSVSNAGEVINGHMRVGYVTISVNNPGAISEGDSATAMIGDIACNDVGTFEVTDSMTILAKTSGTINSLPVQKGDRISRGGTIATIDSDAASSQLTNADLSLQEAQLSRDKILKQLEDYTITAPIDGTVVLKNKKAGEKIENGGSTSSITGTSTNTLAIIYDMSSLCFRLDVDELDVKKIQVGQEVVITADAAQGKRYTGTVENVSISGTVGTNGVTTYPVKVRIHEFDDALLPGMNIEATIMVEESENTLVVPISAVNRGDTVYVKGEKTQENDMAPEGYKTIQVETGLSNESFVEILSGLNEGDIVYVVAAADEEEQMMFPGMGRMPGGMSGGMPSNGMPGSGMSGGGMSGGGR